MGFIFYNGAFILEEDLCISNNSRAFNYGDGFFETIKVINSKPVNLSCHFDRIQFAFSILKMKNDYTSDFFQEKIFHLLKLNEIENGSVKVHISRGGSGRYFPQSTYANLFITTFSGDTYTENEPISLCFYCKQYKSMGSLSNIKSVNSLVSILASIHANENSFDNAILLNSSGNIAEVANANIFIVKNNKIYTPPLVQGCVDGTMRKWVSNQTDVIEKVILKKEILDADEVFITNAIDGLTPVNNIEDTSFTYFNQADHLQQHLINLSLDP